MNNKIFLYFGVFAISLDSYLRTRGLVGLFFLFIYLATIGFNARFNKSYLAPIICMTFGFVAYTCLAMAFPHLYLQIPSDQQDFSLKVLDRISLIVLFIAICFSFNKVNYAKILRNVALIHSFYLLLQFILYYGIGIEFDILNLFDVEQRTSMDYGNSTIFRPAGLYWEPSNFGAYILALSLPYLIKNSSYRKKDYLLPISIILTLSSASYIVGVLMLLTMFLKSGAIKSVKSILILLIIGIPLAIWGFQTQKERFNSGVSDNVNTMLRLNLIDYAIESRNQNMILMISGVGIYSYDLKIKKEEEASSGRSMSSIQDATFFTFTYLLTGLIGLLILLIILFKVRGFSNKLYVLVFMLTKISFLFPAFLFFIYMVFEPKKIKKSS